MRQRFLTEFDALWFDCLNGDSRETGKVTPEGKPDPSVFSTEYNREGIRVGTAICLMVRQEGRRETPTARFRHFWGVTKRADLLESLKAQDFEAQYQPVSPDVTNRFTFRPSEVAGHYREWPKLAELAAITPITGYKENRGFILIDGNRSVLEERMSKYLDSGVEWDDLKALGTGLTKNAARFDAKKTRTKILNLEKFDANRIIRYILRPFELKWCYYTSIRPLWNEPRPSLFIHQFPGNAFLVSRPAGVASPEGVPFYFLKCLGDFDFMRGHSYHFPIRLRNKGETQGKRSNQGSFFETDNTIIANLSPTTRTYLSSLGLTDPDTDTETAGLIWMHALAVGYAPTYLKENADGIRQDWPRVPLPDTTEALKQSARLGRQVSTLLDTETPVPGVTAGAVRPELKDLAVITREGGGP
jgi:hypothetical protein